MKKSFVFYLDWEDTLQDLTDAEAGQLIKHIVSTLNCTDYKAPRTMRLVSIPLLTTIKRDTEKWGYRAERSRENGKKGGRPPKEETQETQQVISEPKKPVSVSDSVSVSNNISKPQINFEAFIDHFNKITGKNHRTLPEKVKGQIRARLKEGYQKEDLIKAVINCTADKYHIETNYKYLTPEFITRADKLEKFLTTTKQTTTNAKKESVNQW